MIVEATKDADEGQNPFLSKLIYITFSYLIQFYNYHFKIKL